MHVWLSNFLCLVSQIQAVKLQGFSSTKREALVPMTIIRGRVASDSDTVCISTDNVGVESASALLDAVPVPGKNLIFAIT